MMAMLQLPPQQQQRDMYYDGYAGAESCLPETLVSASPQHVNVDMKFDASVLEAILNNVEQEFADAECVQSQQQQQQQQQQNQDERDTLTLFQAIDEEFFIQQSSAATTATIVPVEATVATPSPTPVREEYVERYDAQFNVDGRPVSHPFPAEVIPKHTPVQSIVSEFAYPCVVTEEQIKTQMAQTPLGKRPSSHTEMATRYVPRPVAEQAIAFLSYTKSRSPESK